MKNLTKFQTILGGIISSILISAICYTATQLINNDKRIQSLEINNINSAESVNLKLDKYDIKINNLNEKVTEFNNKFTINFQKLDNKVDNILNELRKSSKNLDNLCVK